MLFKDKVPAFVNFKDQVYSLSPQGFLEVYQRTASVHIQRDSDLNSACLKQLLTDICGSRMLDVGCGRRHLAESLAKAGHQVTGIDQIVPTMRDSSVGYIEADITNLPFADNEFDSVNCAHVLEHVLDYKRLLSELRRVCRRKLIIVVPKQRPYRFTFDLHVHFFPYEHSLLIATSPCKNKRRCVTLGGDLYYCEEVNENPPLPVALHLGNISASIAAQMA